MMMLLLQLLVIGLIVTVHIFIARFRFLDGEKGNAWLSFMSGIAIGYVFLHLLPDIAEARFRYADSAGVEGLLASHIFMLTLFGLVFYYGIDHVSEPSARLFNTRQQSDSRKMFIFLHASGYGFYNFLIGYLIANLPRPGITPLLVISGVMLLHFVGLDHHFRHMHAAIYNRLLRWLFAGFLLIGWLFGSLVHLSGFAKAMCFAFLSGAIIINAIKEELPDDERARFIPFILGAVVMIVVVLLLEGFFPKVY